MEVRIKEFKEPVIKINFEELKAELEKAEKDLVTYET